MIAICNGMDLTDYIGPGYTYELEPQYGDSIVTMDGKDHSAKIRDRVKLSVPFIPLTMEQLSEILQMFPNGGAYVNWTYYEPRTGNARQIQAKYDTRSSTLKAVHRDGTEYFSGLVVNLIER